MLRTTFVVAVLVLATIAVAQSCGMSCGTKGGSCGNACTCHYIDGYCSSTPPANVVTIVQCPTQATCNNPTESGPCDDPLYVSPLGVCHTFNGTHNRHKKFECEGTHLGNGTVVITDCASGNVTRIPNDVCIPQNGGWNIYDCNYE
jgi:hypothetical protein